jgi:cytoskeletal protein CcmA (bactofilin family)
MSEQDTTALSERAVAASQGELNALLGRGARFEGKLAFEGKVRIDGDEAEIEGSIEVGTLIVRGGTVRAEIRATAAVEAYAPSRIVGNITAVDVFIDKGVRFEGAITMTERDES